MPGLIDGAEQIPLGARDRRVGLKFADDFLDFLRKASEGDDRY